jgi:hypothetical protein
MWSLKLPGVSHAPLSVAMMDCTGDLRFFTSKKTCQAKKGVSHQKWAIFEITQIWWLAPFA